MKIDILVEETLSRVVTVEAKDSDEAYFKVKQMYDDEEIVLDAEDFSGVEIMEVKKIMLEEQNILSQEDIQKIFDFAMPECSGCRIVYNREYINDEPDLDGYANIDSEDLENFKNEPFIIYYAQPSIEVKGSWDNSAIDIKTLMEILEDRIKESILNKKGEEYV